MNKNYKMNILKKCLGRRYVIITDHKKNSFYFGEAKEVIDENTLLIEKAKNQTEKVSIFDIRSPSKDYV